MNPLVIVFLVTQASACCQARGLLGIKLCNQTYTLIKLDDVKYNETIEFADVNAVVSDWDCCTGSGWNGGYSVPVVIGMTALRVAAMICIVTKQLAAVKKFEDAVMCKGR